MDIKVIILKLVNIWDPLGVYGLAPKDEYDDIVMEIIRLLKKKSTKEEIVTYLVNQYYSEQAKSAAKASELADALIMLAKNSDIL